MLRLSFAGAALVLLTASVQDTESKPEWWGYPIKVFDQQSQTMFPTLRPVSLFIVRKQPGSALRRGDLIAFQQGNGFWTMRVAAVPGDRIAMVDGLVSINGHVAAYGKPEPITGTAETVGKAGTFAQRTERFDGEGEPHQIIDMGAYRQDNLAETVVAPDHVFVLGDNRDNANDSRFSSTPYNPGQIAFSNIYGVVDQGTVRWKGPPEPQRHLPGELIPIIPATPKTPQ